MEEIEDTIPLDGGVYDGLNWPVLKDEQIRMTLELPKNKNLDGSFDFERYVYLHSKRAYIHAE